MNLAAHMVTIDCADPSRLARFWTEALHYIVIRDWRDYVMLGPAEGDGIRLGLQRVDEPRVGKNRAHLDFLSQDRQADVARLVGLGASVVSSGTRVLDEQVVQEQQGSSRASWTVLADPDGNEFCVAAFH
jgi:hypothetical protein